MSNKLPFHTNDPARRIQAPSGTPLGFLPTVRDKFNKLLREIDGVRARVENPLPLGEPAAAVGTRVFTPDPFIFNFDILQTGIGTVPVQYVLRDAVTYDIPIIFPPPGVFKARNLRVSLRQRVFNPTVGVMQIPMIFGNIANDIIADGLSTKKFSYPTATERGRAVNFLWNIVDQKSGNSLSDFLMPDALLLPQLGQLSGTSAELESFGVFSPGLYRFDAPWLFERDAQIVFQFRPITPVLQPSAASGVFPWGFNDLQNGARNNDVTLQVELHGSRHYMERDLLKQGADSGRGYTDPSGFDGGRP